MCAKKIGFIKMSWPGGGLENVVTTVANMMKEDMGIEPILILSEEPRGKVPACEIVDLSIGSVGGYPLKWHPVNMLRYVKQMSSYFLALKKHVVKLGLDIVVALDLETVALLKCVFPDIPVVVWIHISLKGFWSGKGMLPFIKRGFELADAIIVLNKSMKDEVLELCPSAKDKTFVIYNPITVEPVSGMNRAGSHRIAYIGRLSNDQKRIDRLLMAFSIFVDTHRCWKLTVIGDGPDRKMIEALIAEQALNDHVELVGWHEDPWKYLADTGGVSFLALTSDFEGFPTVLCEALVNGIPVVSTDCPVGPSEIVQDKKNGLLVPFGASEQERIENLAKAFCGMVDGEMQFEEEELRVSVNKQAPISVRKQWEEFLEILGNVSET